MAQRRPPPAPAPWAPNSGDENEYVKVRKEMRQIVEFEGPRGFIQRVDEMHHRQKNPNFLRNYEDELKNPAKRQRMKTMGLA